MLLNHLDYAHVLALLEQEDVVHIALPSNDEMLRLQIPKNYEQLS